VITELREPPDADGTSVGASPWLGTFSEQVWALSDERHQNVVEAYKTAS